MALTTQSTEDLNAVIIAQLEAAFSQTIPLLPKSFLRVISKVLAGVFVTLYKYGGFMFLQMFVQTASAKETEVNGTSLVPLTEWGRLIGVGDPTPATNAEMVVTITVLNQTGVLPAFSQLINSDNGVTYITLGDVALTSTIVTANVRAASDQSGGGGAGTIGNLQVGDIMSFANPIANVARDAGVIFILVTAADAESTESYRSRIIDRFQKRPQGGAYADYEVWAESVEGIVNAYPYTSDTPGQVDVYVEATPASSGDPDGIPTLDQRQAVYDAIELDDNGLATRRPANALQNVLSITRTLFDVEVQGLVVDNEAAVQSDITDAVKEYCLDREPYIVGLSTTPRKDRITRTGIEGIIDDLVSAAGGVFDRALTTQAATPVEVYSLGAGEKAKAEVTFT